MALTPRWSLALLALFLGLCLKLPIAKAQYIMLQSRKSTIMLG